MVKLTIHTSTKERSGEFWDAHVHVDVLHCLPEIIEDIAGLYYSLEETLGPDFTEIGYQIVYAHGTTRSSAGTAYDVAIELSTNHGAMFFRLLADERFRNEWFDGISYAESLASLTFGKHQQRLPVLPAEIG